MYSGRLLNTDEVFLARKKLLSAANKIYKTLLQNKIFRLHLLL